MANDMDAVTQLVETQEVTEAPQVKTKKELKKERKEIKKHKKEVKKEAKLHSAKTTKFFNFMVTVVSLFVIVSMIFCSVSAIKLTSSLGKEATAETDDAPGSSTPSSPSTPASPSTPSAPSANADGEASTGAADSSDGSGSNVAGDLSTKEGVVEYFKTAHAKVLSEAKSATRIYDNTTNYESYLEVGGNDTLAGVAQQLMGMFMKENTEQLVYTGADIATNFPPTNNSSAGLTADMIGDYSCKEEGNNYVITLTLNSSKESPDLGDNSAHLVSVVQSKTVEDAAAGFVSFKGLENRYFAPTVTATIDKTTGQMTAFESLVPSHMCFESATVMYVITVENVGIGLQYEQKWTIEW